MRFITLSSLFLVLCISQEGRQVDCIRTKGQTENAADLGPGQRDLGVRHRPETAPLDDEEESEESSFVQKFKVLLNRTRQQKQNVSDGAAASAKAVAPAAISKSAEKRVLLEGSFGDSVPLLDGGDSSIVQEAVAQAQKAMRSVEDSEFGRDISEASENSLEQLNAMYAAAADRIGSRVSPELLVQLRHRNMEMIRELHMKGHLHYPHMHVVNHHNAGSTSHQRPTNFWSAASSVCADDRVVITLVCFALIMLSTLFSVPRKGERASLTGLKLAFPHPRSSELSSGHGAESHDALSLGADAKRLGEWDATITTFSSILGMGFLSLPYAMSLAGWIAAPIIIFFVCCSGYTAHLVTWAVHAEMRKQGRAMESAGWGFLVGSAFGKRAEFVMNVFLVVELWGYVLSGTVATALNLNMLIDDMSVSGAIAITVLVTYLFTTLPGRTLTRINVISNTLFLAVCIMFIATGLMLPPQTKPSDFKFVNPGGLMAACGIIVFTSCSHSVYPAIMQRMEEPEKYPACLKRAYIMACVCYLIFAASGYYLFGGAIQPSAVRNIGADLNLVPLPSLGWMNALAAFCMVMKLSGLQPLLFAPMSSTIEGMMMSFGASSIAIPFVAPAVLTVSAIVAIHFANQMTSLLNIVGSIFCMTIAFVLPVLCYWRLTGEYMSFLKKSIFASLIVMGSTFAVLGFITALDS